MNIAYKYRLYPNKKQAELIEKTFNAARYVFNISLEVSSEAYRKNKVYFSYSQLSKELTELKHLPTHRFLSEVDAISLQQSLRHLEKAFTNFFKNPKHFRYPRFKSKKSRQSYTTTKSGTVLEVTNKHVRLPKIGLVKIAKHRNIPDYCKITSACVSRELDGSYYVSIQCEYNLCINPPNIIRKSIGLDYKSDGFYCDDKKNILGSPKFYRHFEKEIAFYNKQLSHKKCGSNNWKKVKLKLNKLYRKVANCRKDFIEKESTKLIKEYDLIGIENLNMKAISNKGFHNGKSTLDNGFGMFVNRLFQKAAMYGRTVYQVDKWFPSSQICSVCGYQNPDVKDLSVTEWVCPKCGTTHNRDQNAATNIKYEALYHCEDKIGIWSTS